MANLNKVILIGRITADPELKFTANKNVAVCSFTIAINRKFSKPGEEKQADFINIVSWQKTAEFVSKYFKKGNPICISGSIQVRNYEDKEGKKRTAVEVVADEVDFVESKGDGNYTPKNTNDSTFSNVPSNDFQEIADDEELPF